jgi:CxxC motif-containing protein (DUF1111 family)
MKTRRFWVPLRTIGVVVMAVMLMTMGFWALKSPSTAIAETQADPAPIANLTALETTLYWTGLTAFRHRWDAKQGLGPVFTQFQCNECHVNPMDGGGGDLTKRITFFGKLDNSGNFDPLANEGGILLQNNTVARFKPTCHLPGEVIPADATIIQKRLAPMLFGMGLMGAIPESDILAQAVDKGMGVFGQANMVPDENGVSHVGRFGYKAQNATLLQQSGFAFVHEIGITNPLFLDEDPPQGGLIPPECATAPEPNDDGTQLVTMYHFLTYVAPLPPQQGNTNGQTLFGTIGCALCHFPSYTTAARVTVLKTWPNQFLFSKALSSQPVNLYSDLLLHDMGTGAGSLQDQIPLGQASGTQFRTTPLWGLSQRTVYLHDGRTSDINQAIQWHSNGTGEATTVLSNFNALSASDQADVIAFIKSL